MKNEHAQNLGLIKMIKKLSTGTCAGCVFNKLGKCALSDAYLHYHILDEMPKEIKACGLKITHEDLANYMNDEYLSNTCTGLSPSLSELFLLITKIENFKKEIK